MVRHITFYILLSTSVLSIILISCAQPLILKNIPADEHGYLMFGKMPQRSFYENIFISDSLKWIWTAETNGSYSNSSVIIYNDILLVSDLSGRLYAFDRLTGKMIGYEKYPGSISIAPVVYKLRILFVLNEKEENYSTLNVYDFINGKILHEARIEGSVNNELLKLSDGIVLLSDRGELIKYNFTGNKVWSVNTKIISLSSPASNGDIIVCGNQKGELIIIDNNDGKILFNEKLCDGIESGITLDGHTIYFGDIKGNLFAFNIKAKKILWSFNTNAKIIATPVYNNEMVFIGNLAGKLFAVDKINGIKKWELETKGIINTTPLLLNNFLIQPDINMKVFLINPSLGLIINVIELDRRAKLSPVYYDGIIYLGADRGQIYAYQTKKSN